MSEKKRLEMGMVSVFDTQLLIKSGAPTDPKTTKKYAKMDLAKQWKKH